MRIYISYNVLFCNFVKQVSYNIEYNFETILNIWVIRFFSTTECILAILNSHLNEIWDAFISCLNKSRSDKIIFSKWLDADIEKAFPYCIYFLLW